MSVILPESVNFIINRLKSAGHTAYAVGGCIRDCLMGLVPHDWDITTSALPEETLRCFSDFKTIETGIKHGTVALLINGEIFEITTFRIDGIYKDNRRPENVDFTVSLQQDLARRDFTINAIAYNDESKITDCFNGQGDIENKIIRCVGNPDKRFNEDALRILRALRFSSRLGFNVENYTAGAIHKNKLLLKNIAAERIFSEIQQILCGKYCKKVLLEYRDVMAVVIPELEPCFDFEQNNKNHDKNVYEHICASVENIEPVSELRFAMLLHDIGKPLCKTTDEKNISHFYGHPHISAKLADDILLRLKTSKKFHQTVIDLIGLHDLELDCSEKKLRKLSSKYSTDFVKQLLKVRKADVLAQSEYAKDKKLSKIFCLTRIVNEIEQKNICLTLKNLQINGTDLINMGLESGKEIGAILSQVLEKVINGEIENNRDILLKYVKCKYNNIV